MTWLTPARLVWRSATPEGTMAIAFPVPPATAGPLAFSLPPTVWTGWCLPVRRWKPVSLNVLIRMHRMAINRQLQLDKAVVRTEGLDAVNLGLIPEATGRRQLDLLFVGPRWDDLPDGDNALKGLADGLVACGLLLDDGFRHLRWGSIDGCVDPEAAAVTTAVYLSDIGPVLE